MIKVHYFTDKGFIRERNEDSMLVDDLVITDKDMYFFEYREIKAKKAKFIVADGMGGYNRGELASRAVVEQFLGMESGEEIEERIDRAKVLLDEKSKQYRKVFGSTVAGIFIDESGVTVFNSGDSRVYRYDEPFLEQLSKDHSLVQNLVDEGVISHNEMRTHEKKNIVTSSIIGDVTVEYPQIYFKKLKNRDGLFLICSDGVWEAMDIEALEECFGGENILEKIQKRVLKFGATDNFSMILIEVNGE